MAAVLLPLRPGIPSFRFGTALNATQYVFDVRWNARAHWDAVKRVYIGAFYMDISEITEKLIIANVKIVLGAYLGRRSNHPLFRDGVFVAVDTTDSGREATLGDLGVRVQVAYIPVIDLLIRLGS